MLFLKLIHKKKSNAFKLMKEKQFLFKKNLIKEVLFVWQTHYHLEEQTFV